MSQEAKKTTWRDGTKTGKADMMVRYADVADYIMREQPPRETVLRYIEEKYSIKRKMAEKYYYRSLALVKERTNLKVEDAIDVYVQRLEHLYQMSKDMKRTGTMATALKQFADFHGLTKQKIHIESTTNVNDKPLYILPENTDNNIDDKEDEWSDID